MTGPWTAGISREGPQKAGFRFFHGSCQQTRITGYTHYRMKTSTTRTFARWPCARDLVCVLVYNRGTRNSVHVWTVRVYVIVRVAARVPRIRTTHTYRVSEGTLGVTIDFLIWNRVRETGIRARARARAYTRL